MAYRIAGPITFPTLSSLLSTAPKPGMRATALDAPGSDLYAVGGKWGGDPGVFTSTTDPNYIAYMAAIAAGSVYPAPSILIGPTPATAVVMTTLGPVAMMSSAVAMMNSLLKSLKVKRNQSLKNLKGKRSQ
jgi:hypothetical protein